MTTEDIGHKVRQGQRISSEEALFLYENASLPVLMQLAHELRLRRHPGNVVTWQIDRNINITNVCSVHCTFCNFCVTRNSDTAYITGIEEYADKIEALLEAGGDQVLLQGGLNPDLGIIFYCHLFLQIKKRFPGIRIHALGPPEIVYLAKKEHMTVEGVLDALTSHGLDSLPGAGAEILCDRVRKLVSPAKCSSEEWLNVMQIAHAKGMLTSATMMFGHLETIAERIEHLDKLRRLQDKVNGSGGGFRAFIPWSVQIKDTRLASGNDLTPVSESLYLRTLAISRIMLDNIENIQASWLTVGPAAAQVCLHAGANDLGSIMIEENVVSRAGATYRLGAEEMKKIIHDAGFIPRRRNQAYVILD